MQGQAPSVDFLAALCLALGINEQWLISGRGPMRANQLKTYALRDASPSELLSAMASTIERIAERVDRLELFITSMETRLRGRPIAALGPNTTLASEVASVITRGSSPVPAMLGIAAHNLSDTLDGPAPQDEPKTKATTEPDRGPHIEHAARDTSALPPTTQGAQLADRIAAAVTKRPRPDVG